MMRVAAEYASHVPLLSVPDGTGSDFLRQTQPDSIEPLQKAHHLALAKRYLLQSFVKGRKQIAEETVVDDKTVELVAVYGQIMNSTKPPLVFLIDVDSDQVRHHFAQAVIVVALYPNYLNTALGI